MAIRIWQVIFIVVLIEILSISALPCTSCIRSYCNNCALQNKKCYNDVCCNETDIQFEGSCYSNNNYVMFGPILMRHRTFVLVVTIIPIIGFVFCFIIIAYKLFLKINRKSNIKNKTITKYTDLVIDTNEEL